MSHAKRSGRPHIQGPWVHVAVVAAATSEPPHPEATWSYPRVAAQVANTALAARAAVSPSRVGRTPADLDLKPHQVRGWLPAAWQAFKVLTAAVPHRSSRPRRSARRSSLIP